jgi:hypothetical protein
MMDKAGQKSDARIYEAWRDCFLSWGGGGGSSLPCFGYAYAERVTCSACMKVF